MMHENLPPFEEFGIPAVQLLRGVLYEEDDPQAWEVMLAHESQLASYLVRIGLTLVIDPGEGLAYLRQLGDDQRTGGYERLPRLFRRTPLSFPSTLLCALLRDEYRRFEDEDLDNQRCVIQLQTLMDQWKLFFDRETDEVRLRRSLAAALSGLEKLKFVRKFGAGDGAWEVRKALKARLPVDTLENLRNQLVEASN